MKSNLLAAVLCGSLALGVGAPPAAVAATTSDARTSATSISTDATTERRAKLVKGKDRPWRGAGFRTGRRAPGWQWIGARYLGRRVVYRVDPFKPKAVGEHHQPRLVDAMADSARATAQAAWVVSKYGRLKQPHQGAAVEVALHALLAPKKHGLRDKATRARLKSIGKARRTVVKYARVMLEESAQLAGPYQLTVDAGKPLSDGGSTTVTATLRSAIGVAVAGIPLKFSHPNGETTVVETAADGTGVATMTLPPGSGGAGAVTAAELPDVQLRVMRPAGKKRKAKKSPRLVVAGEKTGTVSQPITLGRKARPTLTIAAPTGLKVFESYTFTAQYQGSDALVASPKTARVDLVGPFSTQSAANCNIGAPARYGPFVRTVTGDGSIPLGTVKFNVGGWYRLKGSVDGDDRNEAATAECGTPFLVAKSSISLTQSSAPRSYQYDGSIWFEWVFRYVGPVVSDGTAQNPVITARLHGPFASGADARCTAESVYAPQTKTLQVTQSGEELHVHMRIPTPGVYVASFTAAESDFTQAATLCAISGTA
jgi:hypothetical protein